MQSSKLALSTLLKYYEMKTPANGSFVKPSARFHNAAKSSVEDEQGGKQLTSEDYIKQILSWASVSYAVGFVVVTLHTAKLGLPVIELLHPIYVWVGLPIALIFFFSRRIAALCMTAGDRAAKDIRLGWTQVRTPAILDVLEVVEDMNAAARAVPLFFGSALLAPAVIRLLGLKEMLAAERASDPVAFQRSALRFRRIAGFARVFSAVWSIVAIVVNLLYLILLLAIYVYYAYPAIPQSFGGGKPAAACLIVEETALPESVLVLNERKAASAGEKFTAVLPVTLLYATKDAYYIQVASGVKMSIKADTVKSVVWNFAANSTMSLAGSVVGACGK